MHSSLPVSRWGYFKNFQTNKAQLLWLHEAKRKVRQLCEEKYKILLTPAMPDKEPPLKHLRVMSGLERHQATEPCRVRQVFVFRTVAEYRLWRIWPLVVEPWCQRSSPRLPIPSNIGGEDGKTTLSCRKWPLTCSQYYLYLRNTSVCSVLLCK
jgi:hypothetical protein